jgi:hypothetical protein
MPVAGSLDPDGTTEVAALVVVGLGVPPALGTGWPALPAWSSLALNERAGSTAS